MKDLLIIIPARGGSKGIPMKNIKLLNGKPLIYYSIDIARQLVDDKRICVSTDDDNIINTVEKYGLSVPFKRPNYLASDTAGSDEVIVHALNFYLNQGINIDLIILLQPTSPFRKVSFITEAIKLYRDDLDMVVSVKEVSANPYYNCYETNLDGFLSISKGDGKIIRRQDAPKVWEYNGSIYIINPKSLIEKGMSSFDKVIGYPMDDNLYSVDIDTMFDWKLAEFIIKENLLTEL